MPQPAKERDGKCWTGAGAKAWERAVALAER